MHRTTRAVVAFGASIAILVSGVMVAGAGLSSPSGLTSTTHPTETSWYSDDSPTWTWDSYDEAFLGAVGAGSVDVQGDLLAVGLWAGRGSADDEIRLYDVSNPDAPALMDTVYPAAQPAALQLVGDTLFAVEEGLLTSWDVSDPSDISFLDGVVVGSAEMSDIVVDGDVAYVTDYNGYLYSFDVMDTSDILALDTLAVSGQPNGLDVSGDLAVLACRGGGGIRVIDISDPASLTGMGALATGDPQSVAISGDIAYVAMIGSGVSSIDISNPGSPVAVDSVAWGGAAWDVEVEGNIVYATGNIWTGSDYVAGPQLIDANDPSDLILLPSPSPLGYTYDVAVEGAQVYSACLEGGLNYALTAEADVTPYGNDHVSVSDDVAAIDIAGDTLWAGLNSSAIADGEVHAYDISEMDDASLGLTRVSTYTASFGVTGIDVEGDVLYYTDIDVGAIYSLDVADRTAPAQLDFLSGFSHPRGLEVRGNVAYVADGLGGLRTVSVGVPSSMFLLDSFNTTGTAYALDVQGDVAYLADGDQGLVCLDISDPSNVSFLGSYETGGLARGVSVSGDVAYLGASGDGFLCIDVSDPTAPMLLGEVDPGGFSYGVDVVGDLALAANSGNGVRIIDVSDPSDPIVVETFSNMGSGGSGQVVKLFGSNGFVGIQTNPSIKSFITRFAPEGYSVKLNADSASKPDSSIDTTSFTWSETGLADGTWYLGVEAHPIYGPAGGWDDVAVNIDTVDPSTTDDVQATYGGSASIKLTATDPEPGSGIDATYYTLNGGEQMTSSGASIEVETPGTHTMKFWSVDNAGNTESKNTEEFDVIANAASAHAIEGANRYATAVKVSETSFPDGAATVVLATGRNWPDALGGAALAGAYDAPILLVDTNSVPAAVEAEILRLGATDAIILGGTGAVSDSVKDSLKADGLTVERIGGANRYSTAQMVADAAIEKLGEGDGYLGRAFVATGANFPDALAGSPLSAAMGWPIYLVSKSGSPPTEVMEAAGVGNVLVLGGEGAVGAAQEAELVSAFGEDNVERLAGANRYATGVEVAKFGVAEAGLAWDGLAIATGQNFPDALAGGMLPATNRSVMLLTATTSLPGVVSDVLNENRDWIANVYYLGGTGAVSQDVRDAVEGVLK